MASKNAPITIRNISLALRDEKKALDFFIFQPKYHYSEQITLMAKYYN